MDQTINFGYVSLPFKHLILKDCSEIVLSYERRTSAQNLNKLESYLREKGPRTPPPPSLPLKRGHFMDAALSRKHLKIYNLTTTNATLVKLTAIMYLHKTFILAEDWGVTHGA